MIPRATVLIWLNMANFGMFVVGMAIIWCVTHNWYAMGGALVAAWHWGVPDDYGRKAA